MASRMDTVIETPRLILKVPSLKEFEPWCGYMADEEAAQYIGKAQPPSVVWRNICSMVGAWHQEGFAMFSVFEKATGSKTLPSILGHGSGSQNIASSETLLFMRNAAGAVTAKLNELYSKILTLAVRIFGQDVYVEFKYDSIDLRPDAELEAFKSMRQSRYLELLSLGFIEDDEASIKLTGQLTPVGFAPLKGTGFFTPAPAEVDNANPNSTTGAAGAGGNKQGAGNQARKPATPQAPKGGRRADGTVIDLFEAALAASQT